MSIILTKSLHNLLALLTPFYYYGDPFEIAISQWESALEIHIYGEAG